ncbi:MAG: homoserine dehydrogenase [Clostridiales bacterium]|jgi:homoserine dehydrogenase|nr:homoserine dehydrogenase [Clostridiales bacterium]
MAEIAILGFGTVGSGVMDVLSTNRMSIDKKAAQPIRIKRVLDLRDFPQSPVEKLITHDFDDILYDNDISVVVETMGGVEPAYSYVKRCLLNGKTVVTSNKELVAKHGAELLNIARENNLNFLFEASVGGGIPIIRPLNQSLTADEITSVTGILNGTTNFILTKMTREKVDFNEALKEAQTNGYAEKDPSADVEGFDVCRKLAILLCLATGGHIDYEKIYTEGITKITPADIAYASAAGMAVKLLASAKINDGRVFARVAPVMISGSHPLAAVNDVFNAIFVKGNVIGEIMFYGRGAGKLPTASAVVADVIDSVRHLNRNIMSFWATEPMEIMPIDEIPVSRFIRVAYDDRKKAIDSVSALFGDVSVSELPGLPGEFAFISAVEREGLLSAKIENLAARVKAVPSSIRVETTE